MKLETNCIKCKKMRVCEHVVGVGFLCDEHKLEHADKARKNAQTASWMKSNGGMWLLRIAVTSLIITSVFQVLQYFKT